MVRTLLWLLSGLVLGIIIHIGVILALPAYATNDVWSRVMALGGGNGEIVVLDPVVPGTPNPVQLDPELAYALCRIDLREGPGVVSGTMPDGFWSLAVYNRNGVVLYSTTNRDGIGDTLDLGIFNAQQTRLLARQQLDIAEGLLIVESPVDDVFVLVRLALPHQAVRARYSAALADIVCDNLQS
ncbi:hypothetical protein EMQ25_09060 [Arsenicitalea aurantiaca]|uniref:DUF1254 domain-containing protein n=1 Tax=Arsenicitalea aurantiaca TaxID=1783274 RepID=A0A433XAG5_9HYPH|nr:hypothetical protein [Arsenicitalea aurantiaca]RUT31018.1 hypothetical protein EMQ25_09060 [Arsenicitalea aurantiaca]